MGRRHARGRPANALAPACVVPVSWMLRIQSRVGTVKRQSVRRCVLMCHTPRKEYYKKFLYEAFPVESHLDHALADHLNAEIVSRNVTSQQAAMDFSPGPSTTAASRRTPTTTTCRCAACEG